MGDLHRKNLWAEVAEFRDEVALEGSQPSDKRPDETEVEPREKLRPVGTGAEAPVVPRGRRGRDDPALEPEDGAWPWDTQDRERPGFCCVRPPSMWGSVTAAWDPHTGTYTRVRAGLSLLLSRKQPTHVSEGPPCPWSPGQSQNFGRQPWGGTQRC